jgi:Kef-type K+ transport system membrane component KefB|tara:strand:- start:304 stop:507 length:204 start_codon:yes stop_codon:yes gene_type:complete
MKPIKLLGTVKKTFLVTLASAAVFFLLGYSTGLMFNYSGTESLVIELAMVFSSTIIGIKLLPTKVLH